MEGLPAIQTDNILKVITVIRYVFISIVIVGFVVTGFDLPLASYFSDRRLEIMVRNLFIVEAGYWSLKYRSLAKAIGQK